VAGDDLKKAVKGEALRIPAAAYNAFVDAANYHRSRALGQSAEAGGRGAQSGIVFVRNRSAADQDRFAVLALGDAVISPQDNELEFQSKVALDVREAADGDHEMKYAVLQEPVKKDGLGRGMVFGVTPVHLDVQDEYDDYASFEAGETGCLKTASAGTARILWKEAGTGRKWGVVHFPVDDGLRLKVTNGSGETIPEGGAMALTGADPETPFAFTVSKPSKDSQMNVVPLVGPPLAPGESRRMRFAPLMRFLAEGSELATGDMVGAASGSWALGKTKFGFLVLAVQSSPAGQFAYVFFNGLVPVLKAVYDASGGQVEVQLATSGGAGQGNQFSLAVIPGSDDEGGGPP